MRLLVTGTNGQVSRALVDRAGQFPEISVVAVGRPQLDLENIAAIHPAIAEARPDLIVNAAAYTAVDKAEQKPQRAFAINRDGAAAVAAAAHALEVPFIHLSTDYVFSGSKAAAYVESDETGPLGVYGKSKLAGEVAVRTANPDAVILRTSWVYSPFGSNFVKTMLRLAAEKPELRVVDDQIGNPTSALDLAEAILSIASRVKDGSGGTFHVAGSGSISWFGLAKQVFETSRRVGGSAAEVVPISTSEYPTPAKRPANSRLDSSAFHACFGQSLRDWRAGVEETVRRVVKDQE
ncbi:MAG TPA: dTDP-4-dehydrorhamnose reductase [Aestuariivirga sp.]|nr:dTDP-4-dehydrorhamnose reductase [Aestuariivirga sp.]